ncbi:hypothetical protein BFR04_05725 [Gaetbulibacter sp. 4G1]|nr:hypothetical protein BFR04_05725 [Gaetbulibacter sp. 4G1]
MSILPSFKFIFGSKYKTILIKESFKEGINTSQLFKVTNQVVKTTPYYSTPQSHNINSLSEFESLIKPFDKEILQNKFNKLISKAFSKTSYDSMTTGGTSGAPTRFFVPKNRFRKEFAFYHKIWSTLGYNEHIRGVIRNEKLSENEIYKVNPITKEIIFDGFRNHETYYHKIYLILQKFNIKFLQGYPSSISNFLIYVNEKNLDTSFFKGVFLSSEIFLDHQRSLLIETMKLPVISVYGHSEKLIMAVDFKGNNEYQVIENYGYLELVDDNDNVIKEEGVLGEIVGSTFDNYGMPLLRFKTGDYSSYLKYSESEPRILNGIQGRWQEMKIYNKDGSFVTPTALNLHDELNRYINGLQYVQNEKGKLEVHIIPNDLFNEKIESTFFKHYQDRMATNSVIEIHKVKRLQKRKNGKFILLESKL